MNTETRRVFADGQEVDLKNKEYELLQFLMLHMDIVFSREELYENIWGLEAMGGQRHRCRPHQPRSGKN